MWRRREVAGVGADDCHVDLHQGWTGDGQGFFPESCPVLESEYNAEN